MRNLNARVWLALAVLAIVMGLLLFVPAGTVRYWQAWVYLWIFTGASALATLYLVRKDPALLERRMSGGPMAEKQPAQKLGIGTQLLELARSQLPPPIRLYTFQCNERARRFYERHGFKLMSFSDGSRNEEKCPDILYEWRG
jgi:GNAT superfamily N-acetyltransferase